MRMIGIVEEIKLHTYHHNFGIVIPYPSGFCWEQQTCGVLCEHVTIEGIFIPLPMPRRILVDLQMANYAGNREKAERLWKEMKEWLRERENLEFEEVEAPEGQPRNQEGLQWIKITRWDSPIDDRHKLVGMIVALYYPNSD